MKAATYSKNNNIPIKAGNVLSADEFYSDDVNHYKQWADYGVLCVEMEAAGIYTIAAKYKVQALAILTISDSLVSVVYVTIATPDEVPIRWTPILI